MLITLICVDLEEYMAMVKKDKKEDIKFDDFLVEYRPEIILHLENHFDRCDEGIDSLKRLFFDRMRSSDLKANFYYTENTVQMLYRDVSFKSSRQGLLKDSTFTFILLCICSLPEDAGRFNDSCYF